jgi:1-acyl-sn-glycerol-3-phosphate acyltransferase
MLDYIYKYNIFFIIIFLYIEFFLLFVCLLVYPFIYLFGGNLKNKLSNIVKNYCLSSISFMSKIFLCISFYVNDKKMFDELCNDKNYIIIQNHLTEIDSFIFFNIINSICDNFNLKTSIVLRKKTKMLVPSYGFLSYFGNDIYLQKDINKDINVLSKKTDAKIVYMFPEGTCFTKENKKISNNFVCNNNLFKYKFVLYPRTKGLYNIIKSNEQIEHIYDLTVVYDTIKKKDFGKRFIIINFFRKYFIPKRFYINIKKYNIKEENLKTEEDIEKFIKKVYLLKDNFIDKFDTNINKFKLAKYNYFNGIFSFITVSLIGFFSVLLYFNSKIVRYVYFLEILIFFINYFTKN